MRQYAVVDTRNRDSAKGVWILSTHSNRALAEARLRAYVQGILDGTRESAKAVEAHLPPGKRILDLVPHLQVFQVREDAVRRSYYTGPLYVRRAASRTKRTA